MEQETCNKSLGKKKGIPEKKLKEDTLLLCYILKIARIDHRKKKSRFRSLLSHHQFVSSFAGSIYTRIETHSSPNQARLTITLYRILIPVFLHLIPPPADDVA